MTISVDTFKVRWDKQDTEWNSDNINPMACHDFFDKFINDVEFQASINLNNNIQIYKDYYVRGKYNFVKVFQSLMRILNTYRKKTADTTITTLDEIKFISDMVENHIWNKHLVPLTIQREYIKSIYSE
jgi:hypothetical protein